MRTPFPAETPDKPLREAWILRPFWRKTAPGLRAGSFRPVMLPCPCRSRPSLKKLLALLWFVPLAMLAAALFGALHDQISYGISPEYFIQFKFRQFGLLTSPLPDRLKAALVGVLASWWMGAPLGLLIGIAAPLHRDACWQRKALLLSLPLAMAVTLAAAFCGLLYGQIQTQTLAEGGYRGLWYPPGLTDPRAFLEVGYMHNFAYFGGVLAIPAAWIFHFTTRHHAS